MVTSGAASIDATPLARLGPGRHSRRRHLRRHPLHRRRLQRGRRRRPDSSDGARLAGPGRLAPADGRQRLGIVGDHREDAPVDLGRLRGLVVLGEDPRQLLPDADGLRLLVERQESSRQESERLHVARIGLEAGLELLQRVPRVVALQVEPGELAVHRMVVGLVPDEPLGHLDEVVEPPVGAEILGRLGELGDRLLHHLLLRVELGELDARRDVVGVELDELADRRQRLAGLALAVVKRRHELVLLHGVGEEAELPIDLGELDVHLDEPRIELQDLLVDRDRFQVKALIAVELGDAEIGLGRLRLAPLLGVEVPELQPDADVLRVLFDDLCVLLDRLVELPLLDELLGGLHGLVLVDGHGSSPSLLPPR